MVPFSLPVVVYSFNQIGSLVTVGVLLGRGCILPTSVMTSIEVSSCTCYDTSTK